MSCPHYYNDVCKVTNQSISKTVRDNTCLSSSNYGNCAYYKQASVKGCFITSAVCESQNKPDDCYELTMLRSFRDNWLSKQEGGSEAISEYYHCAPSIVTAIDQRPNAAEIWHGIYMKYIVPCVQRLESGDNPGAYRVYCGMVDGLKAQYT